MVTLLLFQALALGGGAANAARARAFSTVKVAGSLEPTPGTVTTTGTGPSGAPPGTGTTMVESFQDVGMPGTPPKVTVLAFCVAPKFKPLIVTTVPTGPAVGD